MTHMTNIIMQTAREGLYASDVIGGRYQVLESDVFRASYFVYDLAKDDMLRSRDGSCKYFDDLTSAMAVAEGATPAEAPRKAKAPKTVKEPKEPKAAKEPKSTEPKVKKPSANSMIIDLIKTTKLSDDEISAEIVKNFPDCKTCKPYDVKYRRRKVDAGEL